MWYHVIFQYMITFCNTQNILKHVPIHFSFFMMNTVNILLSFLNYMVHYQYSHFAMQ